jgi:putative transposase
MTDKITFNERAVPFVVGNCSDNAAVETFFKTIKAELIGRRSWETRRQAEMAIFEYINGFYNPRRKHTTTACCRPLISRLDSRN